MIQKSTSYRYFWVILIAVLVGCKTFPLEQKENLPITSKPTVLPISTLVTLPTIDLSTIPTVTNTPAPSPLLISTASKDFLLDNLRMAYIVDGNLYVQNGSNSPKQLSNSGEDLYPMFSDDGEKIVFYRGKINDNDRVFSISSDGSHGLGLITKDWLAALGTGTKAGHLAFVPNTHQILFNTYLCPDDLSLGCTVGLFLVNADTGKIKEIMHPALGKHLPWHGGSTWHVNFSISPDGKLMSVAHAGQIDILNMDGEIVHSGIMKYIPSTPVELYPRVFWLSDASGLIAAIPAEIDYRGAWYSGDPAYTISRYAFGNNKSTQIALDPVPFWVHMESNDIMSVSPNRNWVVYFSNDYKLYSGNLEDGSTQLYLSNMYFLPTQWSLDNNHFVNGGEPEQPMLGSVDEPPTSIPGFFLGWIDTKRYIYLPNSSLPSKENIQILVGEIGGETLLTYQSNVSIPAISPYSFAFTMLGSK